RPSPRGGRRTREVRSSTCQAVEVTERGQPRLPTSGVPGFPQRGPRRRVSRTKGESISDSPRGDSMKLKKLFQVLVLGGTALGLGVVACGGSDGNNNGGGQQQTLPDGGTGGGGGGGGGGPPGW